MSEKRTGLDARDHLTTVSLVSPPNSPEQGTAQLQQQPVLPTWWLQVAVWAYTMLAIMPLNRVLLPKGEVEASKDDGQIRAMLVEWGRMHTVRTVLGGVALGGCMYGLHLMLKR